MREGNVTWMNEIARDLPHHRGIAQGDVSNSLQSILKPLLMGSGRARDDPDGFFDDRPVRGGSPPVTSGGAYYPPYPHTPGAAGGPAEYPPYPAAESSTYIPQDYTGYPPPPAPGPPPAGGPHPAAGFMPPGPPAPGPPPGPPGSNYPPDHVSDEIQRSRDTAEGAWRSDS